MENRDYSALSIILAGAIFGAGVALLFAAAGDRDLRERLRAHARDFAETARDALLERGREVLLAALEQGREYLETGEKRPWSAAQR
jgi:gas vesicle protein